MPKIKSISTSIVNKVVTTKYLAKIQNPRAKNHCFAMLGDIDLIFGIVMSYRSRLHFVPVK
jgi:hypothetical protein